MTARSPGSGRRAEGYALVLLAAACWATGGLTAKWLFTQPGAVTEQWPFPPLGIDVDPLVLSAARAMLSFVMVAAYLVLRRRDLIPVRARDLPFLAVFGVFGLALVHFTYFKTISLTGVATAILLEYLAPVIVLVVSVILLGERLTWSLPVAVVLSVGGCALMVGAVGGGGPAISTEGLAWGLASAVMFASYALMGRYAAHRFAPWTLLAYGLAAASLFWLVVLGGPGPVVELLEDVRALAAISVVAFVSTVIPFAAFLKALHLIEATKASITSTFEPVLAGVTAWFVFGEHLTGLQIAGGGLVIGAVLLAQMRTGTAPEAPVTG
ncbi:MAG: EamA family transporter [Coriobacteriia bacterium]